MTRREYYMNNYAELLIREYLLYSEEGIIEKTSDEKAIEKISYETMIHCSSFGKFEYTSTEIEEYVKMRFHNIKKAELQ